MRHEILRVSPLRYAVMLAAIAFILSVVAAVALVLAGGLPMMTGPMTEGPHGRGAGAAAVVVAVAAQTAGGFLGGLAIAATYNLATRLAGGVVIDLRPV